MSVEGGEVDVIRHGEGRPTRSRAPSFLVLLSAHSTGLQRAVVLRGVE